MTFLLALMMSVQTGGYARPELLVDTAWLAQHTTAPNIRIVDLRPREIGRAHV